MEIFLIPEVIQLLEILAIAVVVPVSIIFLVPAIPFFIRKLFYSVLTPKLTCMRVKIASYDETNFKTFEQFFAGIHAIKKPWWEDFQEYLGIENRISFEIVGKRGEINFYVVCPQKLAPIIEKQIYGIYQVAEIDFLPLPSIFDRGSHIVACELKQDYGPFPMLNVFDEKQDPLKTFLSTFSKLNDNEVMAFQMIVAPASNYWVRIIRRITTESNEGGMNSGIKESLDKKITKLGFHAVLRIISISDDPNRASINLENTYAALGQFNNPKVNLLKKKIIVTKQSIVRKFMYRYLNTINIHIPLADIQIFINNSLLNSEELANIYHFPNKDVDVSGVKRIDFKKTSAPSVLPNEGIVLGKNKFRDIESIIRIKDADRKRHMYILGQTGTGKSVFLFSQVLQDIYRGKGVCLLDPHGPDIEALLRKIPEHRKKDVIYFNAADFERPVGINILETQSKDPAVVEIQQNSIINNFIELLRKLYDPQNQGIVGPQFERAVRSCMQTCMVDPASTLIDVTQLLLDDKAADKFLPKIKDQELIKYWKIERAQMTEQTRSEMMGYLTSKFSKFTQDRFIRNIVAQSNSTINIPQIMDQEKILLINLSKGIIGEENAQFLGLLLVPKVLQSAMARAEKLSKGEKFPDFYLYVDEFQNFATDAFESILSEARKFGLGLTVANQYITQLSDKIKNAVFGNVGTAVFFRVGAEDAAFCKKMMDKFEEGDFQYITLGNAYIKLLIDGAPSKPFSLFVDRDLVSPFKENEEIAKEIINESRMKYGRDTATIQKEIDARYSSPAANTPVVQNVGPIPGMPPISGLPPVPGGGQPASSSSPIDDDFFADL